MIRFIPRNVIMDYIIFAALPFIVKIQFYPKIEIVGVYASLD